MEVLAFVQESEISDSVTIISFSSLLPGTFCTHMCLTYDIPHFLSCIPVFLLWRTISSVLFVSFLSAPNLDL